MADSGPRKPPLPVTLFFIPCHEIFQDNRSGWPILIGPITTFPVKQCPTHVRFALLVEFTGCHGSYLPRLLLRDVEGEVVWNITGPSFEEQNPLIVQRIPYRDLMITIPHPGRYVLVMLLNDEEVARQNISFPKV